MQKCTSHANSRCLARMTGARLRMPGHWARLVFNTALSHSHHNWHLHCNPLHIRSQRFPSDRRISSRTDCAATSALQGEVPIRPVKPDAPTSPFHDLGLEDLWDDMGHVRVRQHVNPLRKEFQTPHGPLAWHEVFSDPTKPLMVDVGCGSGRFLLKRQKMLGHEQNALGIEIRRALVKRANKWAELLNINHSLHYVFANATVSLSSLLGSYPGPITLFSVQMPDPQFKKRHRKRRVVQPQLIRDMATLLAPNGHVFLQSDVEEVAVDMRNLFEQYASDVFQPAQQHFTSPVFFSDEVFVRPARHQQQGKSRNASNANGSPHQITSTQIISNQSADLDNNEGANTSIEGSCSGDEERDTKTEKHEAAIAATSQELSSSAVTVEVVSISSSTASISSQALTNAPPANVSETSPIVTAEQTSALPSASAQHAQCEEAANSGQESGSEQEEDSEQDAGGSSSSEETDVYVSKWRRFGWLEVNPMGLPTEREHFALSEGGRVYRVMLVKGAGPGSMESIV